ncbi:MAG: UDP-glucose 4-epimerase GalE, partial [Solirubrobacterales bacterium]
MRILVTGGAGYIGSVSVERLVDTGHEVTVLDSLVTGHREAVPRSVELVVGSIGDADLVAPLLRRRGIDAVLHCAARSLVGESLRAPDLYERENVHGGAALLAAMREAGVRRLVFSSSAAVYGVPRSSPIDESAPLEPINPYGDTKRRFEAAIEDAADTSALRAITLRYFNAAGASHANGEAHDPETHLIPNILGAVETDTPLTLFGDDYPTPDGTAVRDYVHVEDLADAHLGALERTAFAGGSGLLALNLGSGRGFSVREVIDAASEVVGRPVPVVVGPRREGDPPVLVAANDLARDVLSWAPRRGTLEEMIGSAWAWRLRHPAGYGA